MSTPAIAKAAAQLIRRWLDARLPEHAAAWLDERLGQIAGGETKPLFLAFGMAGRKVGKADLDLSDDELAEARQTRNGWDPSQWAVDQAVRTLLVLSLPAEEEPAFMQTLDRMFNAGEVGELVALYQALPLYPHAEVHRLRAAEGIRTNIKSVFCAVAQRNPYPAEQLDEGPWNQMILKCLFVGAQLAPVIGVESRANERLSDMLVDYAHERWAAGRTVSPELWRPVGPCADERALADLAKVAREGTTIEQQAAALALTTCPHPGAKAILSERPELLEPIAAGEITWQTIAEEM